MATPSPDYNWRRYKLGLQTLMFLALVGTTAFMFWGLWSVLTDKEVNEILAAFIGGLIGAISTSLGVAAKDLFNTED